MNSIPCGHLIERDKPSCMLGRSFPAECAGCAAYVPGLHEQERTRCEVWQQAQHKPFSDPRLSRLAEANRILDELTKARKERELRFVKRKVQFCEGAGHD